MNADITSGLCDGSVEDGSQKEGLQVGGSRKGQAGKGVAHTAFLSFFFRGSVSSSSLSSHVGMKQKRS
jgi:hypothetical protein